MKRLLAIGCALLVLTVFAAACSDDDAGTDDADGATNGTDATTTTSGGDGEGQDLVFNGQGNDLDVYGGEPPFDGQKLYTNAQDDPEGTDINAQICFFDPGAQSGESADGESWFIAGEDTNQPEPPAGWGIFRLEGTEVGSLEAEQVGKLTPTYQEGAQAENYGCGLLSDGRIVTTDIGNQAVGAATGQLIVWFPPFDSYEVSYCKLDVGIGTAQSIYVDRNDNIFVSSARGTDERPGGVYRYSPPYPASADADGGCGSTDATGAPMADSVTSERWIETSEETKLATPAGLAPAPDGGLYVSSVFNGVINEYGADGTYVRTILQPPEGETLGAEPYSTGTPLGIGVAPDGTLYYADIGIVVVEGELPGPGDGTGSVRRIVFTDGDPGAPETMADGLAFPDGIGVYTPSG